jgi:hypothetical protein
MGFVLHLSLANAPDTEGWTPQEVAEYDGWGHDSSRLWRKAPQLQKESVTAAAFTPRHRPSHRKGLLISRRSLVQKRTSATTQPLVHVLQIVHHVVTIVYSYTLHHRFFFHTDSKKRLWLAAEDGCEGVGPVLQDGAAGHS